MDFIIFIFIEEIPHVIATFLHIVFRTVFAAFLLLKTSVKVDR